ncbi:MAG: AsmA family protein [Pseudomonadota bacterium]
MRRLFYISSGFILAVLVALFFVPRVVDLNQYKGQIESEVEKALAREAKIAGKISLSLLPFPSVNVNDIRLANDARSSRPDMLKVKKVSASISWLPLLMGQISVRYLRLVQPEVVFEKYADGANWDFLMRLGEKSKTEGVPEAPQEDADGTGFDVHVSHIYIKEGSVKYYDGKSETAVEALNLKVATDDVLGPYAITGGLKLNDKLVSLDLQVGELAPEAAVDVAATLSYAKHQLAAQGSFDQKATQFKGKLDATVQTQEIAPDLATRFGSSVKFIGEIQIDPKRVDLSGRVAANKNEAAGQITLEFTGLQKYFIGLKQLPGKTNLAVKGSLANMNPLSGHADIKSTQFGKFLEWAKVDVSELPKTVLQSFLFKASFKVAEAEILLSGLTLKVGNAQATGDLARKGALITVNVETPRIGPWLTIAKMQPTQELGRVHINGTVTGDTKLMKINTTVRAQQGTFKATGQLKDLRGTAGYNLALDMDCPSINRLVQGFGMNDLPIVLGRVKLKAHIDGNPSQVKVANLKGSIAPKGLTTNVAGRGTYRFGAKRPQLDFDLQLGRVNINSLMAEASGPGASQVAQAHNPQLLLVSAKSSTAPATGSSFKGWSREPIDFSGLNALDATGKVQIASLVYDPYVFDNVGMDLTLTNGNLTIPNFKCGIYGGNFTGKITVQAAKSAPSFSFNSQLRGASLKQLIGKGSQWDIQGGTTNADFNLTTAGRNEFELVSHLNGALNFDVSDATLIGTDYGALARSLTQLTNPAGLIGILQGAERGGKTTKANLKGRFNIVNGVGRAQGVQFTSPPANGTAQGEVNLPKYSMEITAEMQLAELKNLPVSVRLHGPLDAPKKSFNTDQLTGHLFKSVGGQLINRLIGGTVAGPAGAVTGVPRILPIPIPGLGREEESQQKSPPEAKEEQPSKSVPEKVLKGVLRGLFK